MKKLKFLKIGVLAVFFAVIMTSTVVAGTFAKFVSVINGGARSQAAGFSVTDTTTSAQSELNATVMIAPEESKTVANQISYFSQVNTEVSVNTTNLVTGYGALAEDFATIKSGYTTWLQQNAGMTAEQAAAATRPNSLAEMFTITIGDGTSVNGSGLAEQIASRIRTVGTLGGANQYIEAMGANATTAIPVGLVTTITWNTVTDLWDTYIGNLVANELIDNGNRSGISVNLNITIEQLLGTMPAVNNLANTTWIMNNTIETEELGNTTYNINFTSNGESFKAIKQGSLIYVKTDNTEVTVYNTTTNTWSNSAYKTVSITDGSNVGTLGLIQWFSGNGVVAQTYTITTSLTNLTATGATQISTGSTATVTLSANSGYALPSNVTVTNATLDSYNSSTGVITISNPTGNVTITASAVALPVLNGIQVRATLESYSWSEISQIAKLLGAASSTQAATTLAASYNIAVGDTKTYTMTGDNAGTYTARVVGIAHDDVTNSTAYGATKAGLTFETTSLLTTTYVINSSNTNISWENCTYRTTTLPTLLSAMDSDLTSVIVAVNKTTANNCTTTPTSASVTSDTLWLMSKTEMTGESNQRKNYFNSSNIGDPIAEGSQYSYYSVNNSADDRIKQRSGSNDYYWLRSPVGYHGNSSHYCFGIVYVSGDFSNYLVYRGSGVAPCFCL